MTRTKRADEAGAIYHMLNRANRQNRIFQKANDFEAFERVLTETHERARVILYAYCVLPNHWHMVVSPEADGEMSRFAQWLGLTHTQRYNAHYGTTGEGHLYQGRYKSLPVQSDEHFLSLNRYVERNAYSTEICDSPEAWRFESLYRWSHGPPLQKSLLSPWPIPRRPNWIKWVAEPLSARELKRLSWCLKRDAPYGDETWVESTARRLDLESTMRPIGRPKKPPARKNGT